MFHLAGSNCLFPRNGTWNNVSASFGSVDEKNSSRSSGVPVVTLTGKVSFGGIEIVYI